MYNSDFWNRVDLQQICNFLNIGSKSCESEEGSPEERRKKCSQEIYVGMQLFFNRILEFDWGAIEDESRRNMKIEQMFSEVLFASGKRADLAFEMGFAAGFSIAEQLQEIKI